MNAGTSLVLRWGSKAFILCISLPFLNILVNFIGQMLNFQGIAERILLSMENELRTLTSHMVPHNSFIVESPEKGGDGTVFRVKSERTFETKLIRMFV